MAGKEVSFGRENHWRSIFHGLLLLFVEKINDPSFSFFEKMAQIETLGIIQDIETLVSDQLQVVTIHPFSISRFSSCFSQFCNYYLNSLWYWYGPSFLQYEFHFEFLGFSIFCCWITLLLWSSDKGFAEFLFVSTSLLLSCYIVPILMSAVIRILYLPQQAEKSLLFKYFF